MAKKVIILPITMVLQIKNTAASKVIKGYYISNITLYNLTGSGIFICLIIGISRSITFLIIRIHANCCNRNQKN